MELNFDAILERLNLTDCPSHSVLILASCAIFSDIGQIPSQKNSLTDIFLHSSNQATEYRVPGCSMQLFRDVELVLCLPAPFLFAPKILASILVSLSCSCLPN